MRHAQVAERALHAAVELRQEVVELERAPSGAVRVCGPCGEVVEANLQVIHGALTRIEGALSGNPDDAVLQELRPMQQRAAEFEARPEQVRQIIEAGSERARQVARQTMQEVRQVMSLDFS